jgi:hypothetical protein
MLRRISFAANITRRRPHMAGTERCVSQVQSGLAGAAT